MTVSARQARFAILAVLAASSISTACSSSSDAPLPPSGLHYLLNPATYAANVPIAANPPSVSGGAATSFAVSPALPAGLNLDTSTGVVTGTPTSVTAAATYVVTATNASGSATTGLVVAVGPSVRPPYGLSYSANPVIYAVGKAAPPNVPTCSGGAVTSYSVSPALPAGLALSATTGILSGTPTTATAAATYKVTASNTAGSASVDLSLTVSATELAPSGLTYLNNPVTYTVGTAIASNTPRSGGGAVTAYSVSPALPAGLGLNATTGYVTGTPTGATPQATYVVTASNGAGSTTAGLVLTVSATVGPPSSLTYALNPAVYTVGTQITPNGPSNGGGAVTGYTVAPPLPSGLALNPGSGVISGKPTLVVPTSTYVVTASNSAGSTTASVSLTVNAAAVAPTNLVYTPNPATYTAGSAISPLRPPTYAGSEATFSVTPALPAGLSLNAQGAVTGTPAAGSTQAPYVVTATNPAGSTTVTLQIAVSATTLAPTNLQYPSTALSFPVGQAIAPPQVPTHGGGTVTSWSPNPALPAGLSLDPATGAVIGTPTAVTAAASYVITAGNSAGSTTATVSIAVTGGGPTNGTITIATQSTPQGILPSTPFSPPVANTTIHSPLWMTLNAVSYDDVTVTLSISGAAQFYSYPAGTNTAPVLSSSATCSVSYNASSVQPVGCGLGLQPSGTTGSATVTASVTSSKNGLSYTVNPVVLQFAPPTAPARTVTFTNNSSQTIWVGITGGAANSYLGPSTPSVQPNTNPATNQPNMKGGAGQACGPSSSGAAACPIGSTCVQGGANPNSSITATPFYCYYDQGVPVNAGAPSTPYQIAAPTATTPGGSTTFSISGASLSPPAGTGDPAEMIWSGNFYGRTDCDPTGKCLTGECVGSVAGYACGPGTGAKPAAVTLAEVTFQTKAPDYYDVSIIGGANFGVQFGPPVSMTQPTPAPYFCGIAGNPGPTTFPAPPGYTAPVTIAGANWTMAVTSTNFPGTPDADPASYYLMVQPDSTSPTPCSSQQPCSQGVCGFSRDVVNNKGGALIDGSTRYCGTQLAWISADTLWGANMTSSNNGPFLFNQSVPVTYAPAPAPTAPYIVGNLQLCTNNAYTAYVYGNAITPQPSSPPYYVQDPALACGGVIWGTQPSPLPILNPASNLPMNLTYQSSAMTTPGVPWLQYVLPTLTWLKNACPSCYSYPFDDKTSTFQCNDNGGTIAYTVIFTDLN